VTAWLGLAFSSPVANLFLIFLWFGSTAPTEADEVSVSPDIDSVLEKSYERLCKLFEALSQQKATHVYDHRLSPAKRL